MTYMTYKLVDTIDYYGLSSYPGKRKVYTDFENQKEAEKEALKVADHFEEDVNIYQVVSVAKFPRVSASIVAAN